MRFSQFVLVASVVLSVCSAVSAVDAARLRPQLQLAPDPDQRVLAPYKNIGIASPSELRDAEFRLSECKRLRVWRRERRRAPPMFHPDRTVIIDVSSDIDLLDNRNVNALVLGGLHYAWARCYAPVPDIWVLQDFAGVRVLIAQNGKLAVETGRSLYRNGDRDIAVAGVIHRLAERLRAEREARIKEEKRQQELAANQRAQALFNERQHADMRAQQTSILSFLSWAAIVGFALFVLAKFGSKVIGYVRYFLFPHPALSQIKAATRARNAVNVDGNALADALSLVPANTTEAMLVKRDVEEMKVAVREKNVLYEAQGQLAFAVAQMEYAKRRLEALQRRR